MKITILKSIPHELRAVQWDGMERLPLMQRISQNDCASLAGGIDGAYHDETAGEYMMFKDDWMILDADNNPIRIIENHVVNEFYTH